MRKIDLLVVHCSATGPTDAIGVKEVRDLHKGDGVVSGGPWDGLHRKGWSDVGYHYVIRRDGVIEAGRAPETPGAHARGYNTHSIGICLIGGVNIHGVPDANFARAQYGTLETLIHSLFREHGKMDVLGHRDLPGVAKACPCFDVRAWWYSK